MPTYTIQPSSATNDTSISSKNPTTNYTSSNFFIGDHNADTNVNRGLLKFDLSPIPSNATIVSAILTLTPITDNSDNTRTLRVYRQKRVWVHSEATWNIYSSGNNWQTAGGFGANDCEQTDIGSVSIASNQTLNTGVDITLSASAIQEIIDGIWTNNGFLLKVDTESDDMFVYASSVHATASYRPKLVVEYTVPVNGVPVTYISEFGMI